jgi:hypothetical protein
VHLHPIERRFTEVIEVSTTDGDQPVTWEEVREAMADPEAWLAAEGARIAAELQQQGAAAVPPVDPEAEAREQALAALSRKEERERLVPAARAKLDEDWAPHGFDSSHLSDDEALAEAGLLLSREQQEAREWEAREHELRTNPQALARAEAELARKRLLDTWWQLHPIERQRRAHDLGLDFAKVDAQKRAAAEKWGR